MSLGEVFAKNRQVIPRWHTYPMARWLGVTFSPDAGSMKALPDEDYSERVRSWQHTGNLSHAADLVGNALVLNRFDDETAIEAAQFILKHKSKGTTLLLEVTENFLGLVRKEPFPLPDIILPDKARRFYGIIANLKTRIREYPRNPILWMDLAFYYSAIGQTRAAESAVTVALSLNKENRYLLRSSSCFFMHTGSPDTALYFLRQSNAGRYDPWLVAAEIAISDTLESPSRRLKVAKNMIQSDSIPRFHLSELASALGTLELKSGARKRGRKLFSIALEDPTENTLAQAAFLKNDLGELSEILNLEQWTHSFEAQTRIKFYDRAFQAALDAAKEWFSYQPFSSRPVVAGSYIASVALGQFEEAIRIAKRGLLSSPGEFPLKNNLAFSLASLGRTSEAREALASIVESKLKESERSTLTATRGAIAFRSGDVDEGRKLYRAAVESFRRQKATRSETIAKFFWAREEIIIKSPDGNKLKQEALAAAKSLELGELAPPR